MAAENTDTTLVTRYEAIRGKEHDMITELLDVLPRIESLPEERIAQVRDALFHADHPYLAVFVGPFSSGKSSLINALLGGKSLLKVGPTPTTDRVTILRWGEEQERMTSGGETDTVFHPSPLLKRVSFVDTPGLESVFKAHDDVTERFLHRSDTVFMVMLATQAMSAKNLESLQKLKSYGKNIILLINQSDLLSDEELTSVREYVQDQSLSRLGYKPEVWMVSAHWGLEAWKNGELDTALWKKSGLNKIEDYVANQLSDITRLRQKLQTPLQITQNAGQSALDKVRENQATFDKYAAIADNVKTQLDAHRRAQEKTVRQTKEEISTRFGEASMRGSEALRDLFQFSRALASVGRGTLELFRLGNLMRPQGSSTMRVAFERRKALEPLDALPKHVDALSAQMEGRDLQDLDDLVTYSQSQIESLPPQMRAKLIGDIRAPQRYDRSFLLNVRDDLVAIEDEARSVEIDNLDDILRNAVIYLAIYEIVLLLFGGVLVGVLVNNADNIVAILLLMVLGMMMLGLAFVPLRGRMVENAYTARMLKLQQRYLETLSNAADDQIAHGMTLRENTIAPLVRLIEAQTESQNEQLQKLQSIQRQMVDIESSLADLGKNRLLAGLRN